MYCEIVGTYQAIMSFKKKKRFLWGKFSSNDTNDEMKSIKPCTYYSNKTRKCS